MCDAKTEPGMNHIFFCCEMLQRNNKYLQQHTWIYIFHTFLILIFIYDLATSTFFVTLYHSTLRARYHTPSQQHVHTQTHTCTNFHTLLKEMHFFFSHYSSTKYDTYDASLILMKQKWWKQRHIFIHKNTCNLWEIHCSGWVGPVSEHNTGTTHVPCSQFGVKCGWSSLCYWAFSNFFAFGWDI